MSDSEKDIETGFLFASPSFWSGVGRLFDLWGKLDDYNVSRSAEQADAAALYSDWRMVGQDLRDSWVLFHTKEAEHPKHKNPPVCQLCGKTTLIPLDKTHARKQG